MVTCYNVLIFSDNITLLFSCIVSSAIQPVASDAGRRKDQTNITAPHKAAMLSQAPVVPFDTDLYEWENPNSVPNEIQ